MRYFGFSSDWNHRQSGWAAAIGILAAAWVLGLAEPARGAESPQPPNIVFVLADDLGWSDLACYGSTVHQTPRLDRFAREAVRFTDAYTAPVCSPTRASLMTGKSPARLHMTIWREAAGDPPQNRRLLAPIAVSDLPHSEVTIAKRLQAAGYLTALVGKWHLGDMAHYPETHGFDVNIGGTGWGAPNTFFYPYRGGEHFPEFRYVPHLEFGAPGEYLTDRLTDEALKVIDRAGSQPFFLYLAHHAVHTPIEAKPADVQQCVESLAEKAPGRNPVYAAMVHSLDENFGRVLDHLEQRGLAERTIVVFFSDNGGYTGNYDKRQVTDNAPLRSGKGSLYEGGVRVPLMVRVPGLTPRGAECHEPVVSMDLFYTLLSLAGLALPADPAADGRDITPLLKSPDARLDRETLFFHYPHYYATTSPVSGLRARDWKLLEYYEDHRQELYNLGEDLSEKTDLAASNPQKAKELADRLHAWLEASGAQIPQPNPGWTAKPAKPGTKPGTKPAPPVQK